jgi:putative oxidoreductase
MSTQAIFWPLGRLLLGGLFMYGGIRHFFIFGGMSQAIAARGVPFPKFVLLIGSVFQTVAGALLIVGVAVPYAAMGLVIFTIAASVMLLNFWSMEEPARQAAVSHWATNLAIIGGLLVTAGYNS